MLLIGFPFASVVGQESQVGFLNYRDLTVDNGLPSNQITCFTKDAQGFMWIGTTKGLVKYDGSRVEVFQNNPNDSLSISGNSITAISIDGDSVMWVGTATNGLNKFRFSDQSFKRYKPKFNDNTSLPSEDVISLTQETDGTLWIGFNRAGLGKYIREKDCFETIALATADVSYQTRQNSIVHTVLTDRRDSNILWICAQSSIARYNKMNGEIEPFYYDRAHPEDDRLKGGFGYPIQASDGKIYIPNRRKGVLVFVPETRNWENYNEASYNKRNYAENSYTHIQQRNERSFWLGSTTRGIALLDVEKGLIVPMDSCNKEIPDQLCNLSVTCMKMDTENGHWIGTNSGMRLYTNYSNQFDNLKHEVGLQNLQGRTSVTSIYPDGQKSFYYGGYASEGLYYYDFDRRETQLFKPPKAYQAGEVHEMFYTRKILPFNNNTLLLLSDNAIFKFHTDTKEMELIETGLRYRKDYFYLHRLMAHSNGDYYLTTRHHGIYILDSDLRVKQHLMYDSENPNSLVSSNYIYEITEDPNGKVWVGTEDGFSVFDPQHSTFSNFDYLQRIDSIPKLKIILSIKLAPDSSLWFIDSRAHGVYLDYPYSEPYQFKPIITGPEGLAEQLKNVCFTKDGKTILSTAGGLSIMDPGAGIKRYTKRHGLSNLNTLGPIVEMPDGQIAIGAPGNIVLFYPDSLVDIPRDIPIYLSSVSIFDQVRDENLNKVMSAGLELSYLENFFSIQIGMINFDNPDDYVLSYRLAGLSNEWIKDNERKAVFTNVPGGNYTFEGRLQNKDDHTFVADISFPVRVIPPFWKRWWFIGLIFGLILLIITGFYMMHIQRIRKEAALKTEFNKRLANMELNTLRAQMNPHFLFNSLNSIRNQIMSNKPEAADKYLVKFSRLVRQVLNNSRQQLITLHDELEALGLYIDLEASRFDDRFSYTIYVANDVDAQTVVIPPLLIQPFVENAIWHGLMQKNEPGRVSLEVTRNETSLHIIIEDDGIGRERAAELKSKTTQKQQSMGLEITGNRMKIIEQLYGIACSTEIIDLKNTNGTAAGTRIVLTLPLLYEPEDRNNR